MDQATFETTYVNTAGTFATNAVREITEGDMRQFASDISNSFEYKSGATSILSSQVFESGPWDMRGAGQGTYKTVYLGSSGNVSNCKSFTVEVIQDAEGTFPARRFMSPFFQVGVEVGIEPWFVYPNFNGTSVYPILWHGPMYATGASSAIQVLAASGSFFAESGLFNGTVSNRAIVTLFF